VTTEEGWLFANPATSRPYHQEEIQKNHLRKAAIKANIGEGVGWHTFRHSYRTWLDEIGAPMSVQKELMQHASIQTTMNVYGRAMTETKRAANSKVVRLVLRGDGSVGRTVPSRSRRLRMGGDVRSRRGSRLLGVFGSLFFLGRDRNPLKRLVAGVGFEPTTFGL
jgi:hypothetical protein